MFFKLALASNIFEVLIIQHGQNSAFFTFEMLSRTPTGETCPITVTLFVSTSILNDVTPNIREREREVCCYSHIYVKEKVCNFEILQCYCYEEIRLIAQTSVVLNV